MFSDDTPPFGFILAIVASIFGVVVLRTFMTAPNLPGDRGLRPAATEPRPATVTYRSMGVPAGHRLPCSGQGSQMDGPARTRPAPETVRCELVDPPSRVSIAVMFDVDPDGVPANIAAESGTPTCFREAIEESLSGWSYCPRHVRGEAVWRYGERTLFAFSRSP